ncbi:MAG TPA: hypothetical protein VGP08_19840 [Pyrinomonadaceae bacterium]|nr:hypothetical protein [Pyrinomonadaceae bacterium]
MTRRTWGALCAVASVLLLLCFILLLTRDAGRASAAPLLFVGLGLFVAAVKSFRARRLSR